MGVVFKDQNLGLYKKFYLNLSQKVLRVILTVMHPFGLNYTKTAL